LLEGPPGVAKTLVVRTLAQTLRLTFQRIQFTPDLLPADLVGTPIYNAHDGQFVVHRGPVFANVVLADEINRAPAKVQSALLEVMQEHRVTIGQSTFTLDEPFLVLATQNPLEHEGTYPLPEAQLDRFFMQVVVPYPSRDEEREIIKRHLDGEPLPPAPVAGWPEIAAARKAVRCVALADRLVDYILSIVAATRPDGAGALARMIRYGVSPRAALHLAQASRAHAYLARRNHVLPEDVKAVAADVLGHRLLMTYDADGEGVSARDVVRQILDTTAVP
jgi:MoxR-like ATPase